MCTYSFYSTKTDHLAAKLFGQNTYYTYLIISVLYLPQAKAVCALMIYVAGEGNFGKVYTAVNMDSGELLAMKEIRFPQNDHQTIKEVAEEIKIFETLKHPSLVRYYGVEVHRVKNQDILCSVGNWG